MNQTRAFLHRSLWTIVYDEILDRYPRVFAARRADGSDTS